MSSSEINFPPSPLPPPTLCGFQIPPRACCFSCLVNTSFATHPTWVLYHRPLDEPIQNEALQLAELIASEMYCGKDSFSCVLFYHPTAILQLDQHFMTLLIFYSSSGILQPDLYSTFGPIFCNLIDILQRD